MNFLLPPLGGRWKDPRFKARAVLGGLLAANVVAALLLFKPWGGSAEDLQRQVGELRDQLRQRQTTLDRTRSIASKVELARTQGDQFLSKFVLDRRTAYSTVLAELDRVASESGVKPKESQYTAEPIEGSDTLGIMTISASFEANYQSLTKFINQLDRSQKFMIIESVQAQPQNTGAGINVNIKLNVFVRDETGAIS
ncbi:MAG: GspMb/PilO family protein [Bryobacteraceae bacterium]